MNKKNKYIFYKFIKFIKDELNITMPFDIKTSNNRKDFATFAYYDPNVKLVSVYVKNRALVDCMRSVAHEIIHHFQNQTGKIQAGKSIQDVGGDIEDEANAKAGMLVKKFGYQLKDVNIYDL